MGPPRKVSIVELKGGSPALQNRHLSVRLLQLHRVVLTTRTSELFQTLAEVERCIDDLAKALPVPARAGWRNIIDMRLAPTRVHPALDPAFERLRRETNVGFARVAVIVTTPLGRVRAERLNISPVPLLIVGTMEEALDFLNVA
jgi:hypothetical protein